MSKANVDSIGQGRVWTGTDAVRLGLVDRIGTLQDAIEVAAKLARLDNYRTIELPRQKELLEELMQDLNVEAETYFAKKELGENYRYYSEFKKLINEQGIMARMPYYADIR
jgi:protease-4